MSQMAFTPFAGYHGATVAPPGEASTAAGATVAGWPHVLSPSNPLFWFGLITAATLGLIGVAGSVKLGPAKAAASLGK